MTKYVAHVADGVLVSDGTLFNGMMRRIQQFARLLEPSKSLPASTTAVFCGTTGMLDLARREKALLESELPGAAQERPGVL